MKAYRGVDNKIRMFRPMHNMDRMLLSAQRCSLPEFDPLELLSCIQRLVHVDQEWLPQSVGTKFGSSLYIRPTLIGTDPTLGVTSSKEAELFVIMSPTGSHYSADQPIILLAYPNSAPKSKIVVM